MGRCAEATGLAVCRTRSWSWLFAVAFGCRADRVQSALPSTAAGGGSVRLCLTEGWLTVSISLPARTNDGGARRRRSGSRRRPPPLRFYALGLVVTVLTMFGLVMVLSASAVTAMHAGESGWLYFRKQLLWASLGGGVLLGAVRLPYQRTRVLVRPVLALAFALMLAVQIPGLGHVVNGARAWLYLGPVGLQPSELMKFAILLYGADLFARRADHMHDPRATLGPLLVVLGAAELLIVVQADLGSGLVLAGIALSVAFLAGVPLTPLAGVVGVAGLGGAGIVVSTPFRRDRWLSFLNLAAHRTDTGFQVWQGLVGIASGGLTGVGLGASREKWGYLPEAHTDLVFAVLAEELGLIGVIVICGLYVAIAALGARVALNATDRYGQLLAGGITMWITVQAIINIGGVVALLPLTGITLPFLSFGGSSLIIMLTAAGLLLNIARSPATTHHQPPDRTKLLARQPQSPIHHKRQPR